MTKHTAIIFFGILVIIFPVLGLPSWVRTILIVLTGAGIVILAYLSSVVYCSNCKKLVMMGEEQGEQKHTGDREIVDRL
ncbi:MAG: hypothetical protein HY228_02650 [Candidatus Yonathbacteria bacterium]|nr:hypothetical protein [Candidatus Yonathbacteria bacterium]